MLASRFIQPSRHALRAVVARNGARPSFRPIGRMNSLAASHRLRYYATEQKLGEDVKPGQQQQPQGQEEGQEGAKKDASRDQEATGEQESSPATSAWTESPFFVALLIVGTGLIAYGAYGLYTVMTMWPQEVRSDLRSGLRAKRKGDHEAAIAYLSRAWETAKSLPLEKFGDGPLLKVTGIGIALGGLLEDWKDLHHAYKVYEDTLWLLRTAYSDAPPSSFENRPDLGIETLKGLTQADRMRAVALSYKLAEVAQNLDRPSQEEEKWLVWTVEAILRTVLDTPPMGAVEVVRNVGPGQWGIDEGPKVKVLVEQLGLPEWTMRHDIAAPFEALGTFYAKSGNMTYALPLYLQAISILLPPTPNVAPVEDKCRGAQLMGNVAELMIRSMNTENASPEALSQAEAWAKKGLDVVMAARKVSPIKYDVCEESLAMLLYNVAMIRDLSGDKVQARALLSEALEQSKAIGMEEGIKHSQEALRALDEGKEGLKPFSMIETESWQEKSGAR